MKHKILLMSRYGDGLDLAIDAARDGHEVKCWVQDRKSKDAFDGLVEKVDDWQKDALDWCDYVIFDANHLSAEWEIAVKKKPCWGGSKAGEKMEQDRMFARQLMEKAGLKTFEAESFKTVEEAVKHVKEHKVLHVVKIVGGDADSDDIIISEMKGGEDAIALMERYVDAGKKFDLIEVEERILGIEVGCAGYFNGKDWIGPIELNFQHKEVAAARAGADRGLGFLCGESGTVIKYVSPKNAFFKKTLARFADYLRKIDYRGEIDIGTMTNEQGIFPIEFTPRFGYPDVFIRRALAKSSQFDLFRAGAEGKPADLETLPGWALGYLVMAPGFPYAEAVDRRAAGIPVFGYQEQDQAMHLMEVKKGKRGLELTKGKGYAAVVSGRGATIESAQRNAYWPVHSGNAKRLYIPKTWVRVDVGARVLAQQEDLLELGVLTDEEWNA